MDKRIKDIALLGSTGSIGKQALDVIKCHPEKFKVQVLTAQSNSELLIAQSLEFRPASVVIADESKYTEVADALKPQNINVFAGQEALKSIVAQAEIDTVLTALVGCSGLEPTMNAIVHGKNIALANKETLVVAGELITRLAKEKNVSIYPVDSEHSAIFQCLEGERPESIEKLILTASGGPFRGKDKSFLKSVTKIQALNHPNWTMGAKITIDSATLMNKGLEVIEARWLFGIEENRIDVVIHPQSIIHSLVQFCDGSIKAQMGLPDMRIPIQYALSYPERLQSTFKRFSFADYPSLTFEQPDLKTFKNLSLAFEALNKGGNLPCILNAANEVVVAEFLKDNIGFLEMSEIVETCMVKLPYIASPTFEDYINTDKETRIKALEFIY